MSEDRFHLRVWTKMKNIRRLSLALPSLGFLKLHWTKHKLKTTKRDFINGEKPITGWASIIYKSTTINYKRSQKLQEITVTWIILVIYLNNSAKNQFKHLESMIEANSNINANVISRIVLGWLKWRVAAYMLCDR